MKRYTKTGLTFALAVSAGLASLESRAATRKEPPTFTDVPGVTGPSNAAPTTSGAGVAASAPLTAPPGSNSAPVQTPPPLAIPAPAPTPSPAPAPVLSPTEEAANKTLYSFQANDLDLKAALASFAKANNLNIVPDNDVSGAITLDIRDLPLDKMMKALLEASDCTWVRDGGLIRVHTAETRTFNIDYLRLSRNGRGQSSATLNSATASGGGGFGGGSGGGGSGGGGSGGGGSGGGGSGGGSGAGGAGGPGGGNVGGSSVNLTAENLVDFWKELRDELGFMLTERGKASMAINMTAGIVQITDRASALKRVEDYLSGIGKSVHRQVDIEARIYDVTLNDQFQFGIDWMHVAEAYGGGLGFGGSTLPSAIGGNTLANSAVGGLNTFPGSINSSTLSTLVFTNFNTSAAINALKQQGNVEVISKPRIRTLNNQTALIKVGVERPFFAQSLQANQSQSGNQTFQGDQVTMVTVGTILSITPQVASDDYVSLDISPVLSSLVDTIQSPSRTATAPVLDTKQQASTLVRVHDANTVVLGGLIQTSRAKNESKIPLLGDIPLLGKLFTGTFKATQKRELVIFVTPHIVRDGQELPLPAMTSFQQ